MENQKRKKIIYIITKSNWGGAQKYVFMLAKQAQKRGLNVLVVLGGNGSWKNKLETEAIKVISLKSMGRDINIFDDFKSFLALMKIFLREKPDVVHLNSSKIGGLGSLAARICLVPKIIFTIHGWAFNENRDSLSKLIIKILYFITILFSTKTVAVSNQIKEQTKTIPLYKIIFRKIFVIKNSVEKIDFIEEDTARDLIFQKIGFNNPDNKKIVGTICELHPIKGLEGLIKAFKKIDEAKLIIVGSGELENDLKKQVSDLGLQNKVFLAGFIEDGAKYLKAFDIFILNSFSEAMALVILEAGQAELPVIATRVGGIPEIIEDKKTGLLIESGNEAAVSEAIDFFIRNESSASKMAFDLKNKIETEFNVEDFYLETFEIYS